MRSTRSAPAATPPEAPRIEGRARLLGTVPALELELDLTTPAELRLAGSVLELPQEPRFDLAMELQPVDVRQVDPEWPAARLAAQLTLTGSAAEYRLSLDADVTSDVASGHWRLTGKGDTESFAVEHLAGELLDGLIEASGTVGWQPELTWDVELSGDRINPGAVRSDWPGQLSLDVATTGRLGDAGPAARLLVPRIDGELRGYALGGGIDVDIDGERFTVERLELLSGDARLEATGELADAWNLDWQIDVPALEALLPEAGGTLTGSGRLEGPKETPRVMAELKAGELVHAGDRIGELHLDADLSLAEDAVLRLDLQARDAELAGEPVASLVVSLDGRRDAHQLEAAVDAERGELNLTAAGGLDGENQWRGALQHLTLRPPEMGAWKLDGKPSVVAGAESVELDGLCLAADSGGRLCATLNRRGDGEATVKATLERLPLELLQAFVEDAPEMTGTAEATVDAAVDGEGAMTATVDAQITSAEMSYEQLRLPFESRTLHARLDSEGAAVDLDLVFPELGEVQASIAVPGYAPGSVPDETPLSGRIAGGIDDLGPFQVLAEDLVDDLAGRLEMDLDLTGTLGKPVLRGEARLAEAAAEVPEYGLALSDGTLTLRGDGEGRVFFEGSLLSGDGTLQLSGEAPLVPTPDEPVRLRVEGDRFLASDTPDARLWISPRIEVTATAERLELSGELTVPKARIELQEPQPSAVAVSRDVVVVGAPEPPPPSGPQVVLDLRVVLGDDVEVEGPGLLAQPGGRLLVRDAGDGMTGAGELVIRKGSYKAYGQDLQIDDGKLIFAGGPIENPGLDIKAYRRADDGVIAGVTIRGTASEPLLTLYSEPPMAEADALSYLVLGHRLDDRPAGGDGDLLGQAAAALGVKGGNLLLERLGARYGFEQATIRSEGGVEDASLVLGKYLSPKLFVSYGVGLFKPLSTLQLRYQLNRRWTLQAEESDEGTGGDVLFTVER